MYSFLSLFNDSLSKSVYTAPGYGRLANKELERISKSVLGTLGGKRCEKVTRHRLYISLQELKKFTLPPPPQKKKHKNKKPLKKKKKKKKKTP